MQAQSFRTPAYSEGSLFGGGFALSYNGRTATDVRSELGARFDRAMLVWPDTLSLSVAGSVLGRWIIWVSDPTLAAVFQALPGASFVVNGVVREGFGRSPRWAPS